MAPHRFEVQGGSEKRIFYFLARNEQELETWLFKIQNAISAAEESTEPDPGHRLSQ
jgi:hypothetical protein